MIFIILQSVHNIISNLIIQWGAGDLITRHPATIYLPIAYSKDYSIFGVTFWIDTIGRHAIKSKTLTSFSAESSVRSCGTDSWLTIGT